MLENLPSLILILQLLINLVYYSSLSDKLVEIFNVLIIAVKRWPRIGDQKLNL